MIKLLRKQRQAKMATGVLMRQLTGMLTAGMPITRCFEILEKTQQHTASRAVFYQIKNRLLAGHSLHDCLRQHPDWFDAFTCRLIHLGEQTGKLDDILLTLAVYHESRTAFLRNIRQALFYPCIILSTALTLSFCMLVFVIPSFAELFADTEKPLPLLTRFIFAISSTLRHGLPLVFVLLTLGMATLWMAYRRGKLFTSLLSALAYLPPLAAGLQTLALIRFIRNLALALSAGIPILDALHLSAGIGSHVELATAARQLRAALSAGKNLYQAMETIAVFPVLVRQMVKVGEESGTLDKMLSKTAELLESQLNTRITQLTQLLEPLIMSVLGVLIGGLVIGMYLPVFNLGNTL